MVTRLHNKNEAIVTPMILSYFVIAVCVGIKFATLNTRDLNRENKDLGIKIDYIVNKIIDNRLSMMALQEVGHDYSTKELIKQPLGTLLLADDLLSTIVTKLNNVNGDWGYIYEGIVLNEDLDVYPQRAPWYKHRNAILFDKNVINPLNYNGNPVTYRDSNCESTDNPCVYRLSNSQAIKRNMLVFPFKLHGSDALYVMLNVHLNKQSKADKDLLHSIVKSLAKQFPKILIAGDFNEQITGLGVKYRTTDVYRIPIHVIQDDYKKYEKYILVDNIVFIHPYLGIPPPGYNSILINNPALFDLNTDVSDHPLLGITVVADLKKNLPNPIKATIPVSSPWTIKNAPSNGDSGLSNGSPPIPAVFFDNE